ncbi:MAG: transporter substrate-binding domain-containing protein [Cucumibacter sp.]
MLRLTAAAALLAAFALPTAAQELRLGTEGAYAPWNFMNDAGVVDGFEIELGNAICERAGWTCTWVVNEWDSIIPNLVGGNYDAIMAGMSITEERMLTIDFSQDYYPPDPSVFIMAGDASFDFGALSGVRIGVQGATIQAAYAEANFAASNTILAYETGDQSVADLAAGNVDMVLADNGYLRPIAEASGGAFKIEGPEILIGGGVGVGLRKADDELEATFNATLDEMKADGSLDALIGKWFQVGPFYSQM